MTIFLIAAMSFVAMTWMTGWWGVPLAAFVIGALSLGRRGIAWLTSLAAIVAWAALLLLDTTSGRFGALSTAVAGVMRVPAAAVIVVTLLFAALLAWSAAVVGSELARALRRDGR
jgi:hypothetical protein